MSKVLAVVLGIAAGALGGGLIVLLIAFSIYDPGPGSWDFATPLLIFGGGAVAALFGGAMGALAGVNVAEGRTRRGLLTFAGSMAAIAALTLLSAGGLWAFVRMPRPGPGERDKDRWADTRGPLDPRLGRQLAHQLLGCHADSRGLTPDALARGGCTSEQSFLIGKTRASYDSFDNGWRWESIKTPRGYKVVVRPDPLLKQAGPIFEFDDDRLLVRRDAADRPGFAVDSPIPAVEAYRQCLSTSGIDGCRHLERRRGPAEKHRGGPAESFAVTLGDDDASRLEVRVFPEGRHAEGTFELHVAGRGRRYMFVEGGDWHVTPIWLGGIAIAKNPPPEPCERDLRVPCAGELQKLATDAREELYRRIATRIRFASPLHPRERVIVRVDPATMPGLERAVEQDLRAQRVELIPYGPVENFEERLAGAVAYVWLPTSVPTPADQLAALARWTDAGGRRHEIHVHWMEGTLDLDGRRTTHDAGMDTRYLAAAETSPLALIQQMDRAISAFSTAEVRVTTPGGTDIRFRTMGRPFNRQVGAFDTARTQIRIDRHIEVPPGVLRVAPLETSVNGVIVLPSFWIRDGVRAAGVRLEFTNGRITRATAAERQAEVENYLRAQPALLNFREFCLGFNPELAITPGEPVIPYYGYGAGVVRMSLGDNEELGGSVRGGAVRWNFFVDATVVVGEQVLVKAGRLTVQ